MELGATGEAGQATNRSSGAPVSGAPPAAWRDNVRQGMLTVAAFIAPPVVTVAFVLRAGRRSWLDDAVLVATGLLLPLCRIVRGSLERRSLVMLGASVATSLFLLARIGLTAGLSVSLATFAVLTLICVNRPIAFGLIALSAVAYVGIGFVASRHHLTITAADTDPYRLRNWVRMGTTSSLLSILLMMVIDFVIRHVEANARSAAGALARLQRADAERDARETDLRIAYERLAQLHQKLEATKEEERRSLSRELHDELGQTLTALKLRLQLGPSADGADPRTEPIALVDDLISRVRKISVDLRPPLLDEVGLVSALRVYLEAQSTVSGVPIDLEADEAIRTTTPRLPPDTEIACFRVVQESVTNALRHADARRLRVRIARSGRRLALSIRDDGRGFDPATLDEVAARGHLGVVGMRERIRARGGRFSLTSSPGGGTAIDVELEAPPLAASG
ncbi:MAG TPA: sensor histidine kinase [Polyangia bacterium]|nr:sensor histidine kinase [Polyangia bacterium]